GWYLEGGVLEVASRGGRKEVEEEWKQLRRGWYVGDEAFGQRLAARLKEAVKGRKRESHSGSAKAAHGELAAEGQLERGLQALGLADQELSGLPKGALEKVALAGWLRENTTASLRWVSERLMMGHYTRCPKR